MMVRSALVFLLAGITCVFGSYRLPLQVIPVSYDLKLAFLEETFHFYGTVQINVTAKQAVPNITLHVDGLDINKVEVSNMEIIDLTTDEEHDFFTIHLNKTLEVGALYSINIKYQGNITEELTGFYRSSYDLYPGEKRWLATTQFEPTYARSAFPCFDEPALKATFDVHIAPPYGHHAISNMPEESVTGPDPYNGNRLWYKFARTVPMSTYLVAFVVSDFGYLKKGTFRIFGDPNIVERAEYALSVSRTVLETMANLTGHPYQLPKMDQVAVPQFQAGAMENWGLVTYRDWILLPEIDDDDDDDEYILYKHIQTLTIMAHEFSHQWFGNQVSPKWWSYIWLNEGFATFFEYFAANKAEPNWLIVLALHVELPSTSLYWEGSDTHPLTQNLETPTEIQESFDMTTYYKGGCVIRGVYYLLGESAFFKGLNLYIKEKSYDSAEPFDLYEAWQRAADEEERLPAGISIMAYMDSWTLQEGYPVITVTRDYAAGTATLTQTHFNEDGKINEKLKWYVPITYTTSSEWNFEISLMKLWLVPSEESITISGLAADDWLIVNVLRTHLYRVNYDTVNWNRLIAAADSWSIPLPHMTQVYDDREELEEAGLLPPGVNEPNLEVPTLLSHLKASSPISWKFAFLRLNRWYDKFATSDLLPNLYGAFSRLLNRGMKEVGLEQRMGESKVITQLRPTLVRWACLLQHPACDPVARSALQMPTDLEGGIPEESRAALWCAGVRMGDDAAWNAAWERYTEARDDPERRDALHALACAPDARPLLEMAVEEGERGLRSEDVPAALAAVCRAGRPAQCEKALEFVRINMHQIADRVGDPGDVFAILKQFTPRLATKSQLDEMEAAVATLQQAWPHLSSTEELQPLLVEAEVAVRRRVAFEDKVKEWLIQENLL